MPRSCLPTFLGKQTGEHDGSKRLGELRWGVSRPAALRRLQVGPRHEGQTPSWAAGILLGKETWWAEVHPGRDVSGQAGEGADSSSLAAQHTPRNLGLLQLGNRAAAEVPPVPP